MTKTATAKWAAIFSLLVILAPNGRATQIEPLGSLNKTPALCGENDDGWGYNLDSLDRDVSTWGKHPYVTLDTLGNSVMGKPLLSLTITSLTKNIKPRIAVHARTHPREFQSSLIMAEMINFLLDSLEGQGLLDRAIFHFVPMLNPDGVQLGCPRENANDIDLESAWYDEPLQPEVAALKNYYQSLMGTANPTRVSLNLHSSVNLCSRFFFFHAYEGTSRLFEDYQREYIELVQQYFEGGIEDWNYQISWTSGNPLLYPESFYWENYGENVLALTYEDSNCPNAGSFDRTARALIMGSVAYINEYPERVPIYDQRVNSIGANPNRAQSLVFEKGSLHRAGTKRNIKGRQRPGFLPSGISIRD